MSAREAQWGSARSAPSAETPDGTRASPRGDEKHPGATASGGRLAYRALVQPSRWSAGDRLWLAVLLAAWAGSRLAWIGLRPESASYFEEAYRWMAIAEWLEGSSPPLLDLQADHYQGGSLVVIALGLPVFALLGESTAALKAVALLFSGATLALLYALHRRYFGATSARLAGAAYVALPAAPAYWSLVVLGSYAESLLASVAQLALFLGLLSGRRSAGRWLAFGLLSGLGIWLCYASALSLAACALTWLWLERLPRPRELALAAAGAALGLVPWLVYNLRSGFAGLQRPLEIFGLREAADPWTSPPLLEKAAELFTTVLPGVLLDPAAPGLAGDARLWIALGVVVPCVPAGLAALERALAALRDGRRPPPDAAARQRRLELVFPVYVLLYVSVYLASRYAVVPGSVETSRLFTPLVVLGLTPVCISLARAIEASRACDAALRSPARSRC